MIMRNLLQQVRLRIFNKKGPIKRTNKGREKPYVHFFKKSESGTVEVIQKQNNNVYSADIFQDFLHQIDLAKKQEKVFVFLI